MGRRRVNRFLGDPPGDLGQAGIALFTCDRACVAFGVFYLLEIWDRERAPGLLVAIGLLAGFAYAVKYTAALAIPRPPGRGCPWSPGLAVRRGACNRRGRTESSPPWRPPRA